MHMIGRRDGDRIDLIIHLDQHTPKILVSFGSRKRLKRPLSLVQIHVTQGHDVFARYAADIAQAFSAHTDTSNVQFAPGDDLARARGNIFPSQTNTRQSGIRDRSKAGCFNKFTAIHLLIEVISTD